uniref:Uncharacterized protein n=1 Tax=Romanomermis culicivorax TaxID=13658 RepID=A0A915HPI5_ROMCU
MKKAESLWKHPSTIEFKGPSRATKRYTYEKLLLQKISEFTTDEIVLTGLIMKYAEALTDIPCMNATVPQKLTCLKEHMEDQLNVAFFVQAKYDVVLLEDEFYMERKEEIKKIEQKKNIKKKKTKMNKKRIKNNIEEETKKENPQMKEQLRQAMRSIQRYVPCIHFKEAKLFFLVLPVHHFRCINEHGETNLDCIRPTSVVRQLS